MAHGAVSGAAGATISQAGGAKGAATPPGQDCQAKDHHLVLQQNDFEIGRRCCLPATLQGPFPSQALSVCSTQACQPAHTWGGVQQGAEGTGVEGESGSSSCCGLQVQGSAREPHAPLGVQAGNW